MTAMATTILMAKRERGTGDPKRANQTCTEVVPRGLGNGFWIQKTIHPQGAKFGGQNPGYGFWNSENESPTSTKRTHKRKRCLGNLRVGEVDESQREKRCYPNVSVACGRRTLPLRGMVVPAQDLRFPRRLHHHCWRQAFPLRRSVAPAKLHWYMRQRNPRHLFPDEVC